MCLFCARHLLVERDTVNKEQNKIRTLFPWWVELWEISINSTFDLMIMRLQSKEMLFHECLLEGGECLTRESDLAWGLGIDFLQEEMPELRYEGGMKSMANMQTMCAKGLWLEGTCDTP